MCLLCTDDGLRLRCGCVCFLWPHIRQSTPGAPQQGRFVSWLTQEREGNEWNERGKALRSKCRSHQKKRDSMIRHSRQQVLQAHGPNHSFITVPQEEERCQGDRRLGILKLAKHKPLFRWRGWYFRNPLGLVSCTQQLRLFETLPEQLR